MTTKKGVSSVEKIALILIAADILLGFAVMATRNSYISTVFSALVFVSGIWLLYATIKASLKSMGSSQWVGVPYVVGETRFSWEMGGAHRHSKFTPYFQIEYSFGGAIYSRSSEQDLNLHTIPVFGSNKAAHHYLDEIKRFKYGELVFVNPGEPSVAYLRTGMKRDQYGRLIFSMMLTLLPVLTYAELIHWRY